MRDELVGYLLGALEPHEERALEARLEIDAELRRELEDLRRILCAKADKFTQIDPPADLAKRTCTSIDATRHSPPPPVPLVADADSPEFKGAGGWRRPDVVTLVGLAVAAAVLIMPLLSAARQRSQIAACRDHMREVGRALIEFSRTHDGYFPEVPQDGPLAHAGIFAVRLREAGYLADTTAVYCPARVDAAGAAPLPTLASFETVDDAEAETRFAALHGLFGYALGHMHEGRYHSPRNRDRAHFAVLADAPSDGTCRRGGHGCGQNVWFEDGHAEFLSACRLNIGDDEIYHNRHGYVGAGIGPDDVVIGASVASPRIVPVEIVE